MEELNALTTQVKLRIPSHCSTCSVGWLAKLEYCRRVANGSYP